MKSGSTSDRLSVGGDLSADPSLYYKVARHINLLIDFLNIELHVFTNLGLGERDHASDVRHLVLFVVMNAATVSDFFGGTV